MRSAPASSEFKLADLVSRLEWGQIIKLHSLSDGAIIQALQLRAQCKGLQLSQEVASYLTSRMQRDMPGLTQLLDTLDSASLAHQRRMTIPFVKSILESI
jgi:DnaA family protein